VADLRYDASYERGWHDCTQDFCENIPFSSVGGPERRGVMEVPDYVVRDGQDQDAYLAGYKACVRNAWGEDWMTASLGWQPVLIIGKEEW